MENAQIAEMLDEIADLLELSKGDQFRIRAYRGAAQAVRSFPRRLEDMVHEGEDLRELPHVGASTAEKIKEILSTGSCQRLAELRGQMPAGLSTLMKVPRLGPAKVRLLYEKLGISTLEGLKAACLKHLLRDIPTLGEKTEENILKGLEVLSGSAGRILLKAASDHVEALLRHLRGIKDIQQCEVAGSYRRRKETVGDLDVLVQTRDRDAATEKILKYPAIREVLSRGGERVAVRLDSGLQVDFRYFEPESFGSALMYFTGSKDHNIALRKLVLKHGWKLNEYGLFEGDRRLAGAAEQDIYRTLGLQWVPPELRENFGEIDVALGAKLPDLIEASDLHGDLHCHTKVTDGADTIEEMAEAAQQRGYEYLAITDHSKAVAVTRGCDEKKLRKHAREIRAVNARLKDFWLLAGVEVDILKDGQLDLDHEVLADLDWVVASVHSRFEMSRGDMTRRLVNAIESGVVHCLGHPTGRLLGHRDPVQANWDEVFTACREHGVRLEINAQPDRLDLPDHLCREAKAAGVGFVISTDAHKQTDLDYLPLGVNVARRGWLRKEDVLNTMPVSRLRHALSSERRAVAAGHRSR